MGITSKILQFRQPDFYLDQLSSNRKVQWFYICYTYFSLLFCMTYQNFYTILFIIRFVKEGGIVWDMLSRFLSCLGLAMSFNYATFKYKTLLEINDETKRIYENLTHENVTLKKFPSAFLFQVFGTVYLFFSEAMVTLSFWAWRTKSNTIKDKDMWVEIFCSSGICDFASLDEEDKNTWYSVDMYFYTWAVVGCGAFLNVVYCYDCLVIISFSESASTTLKTECEDDSEEPLTREFVLKCREYCRDIKQLLRLCNNVFSGMFVIWYGVSLICTCDFLSRILKNSEKQNSLQIALCFFIYGQSFISVIIVSFVSSKLPNIFNKVLTKLQSLTLNKSQVSLDVFAELNILQAQIQSHPTGVEIGGCFLITKAFFVSYLGTIITFVTIVIQLNSKYK